MKNEQESAEGNSSGEGALLLGAHTSAAGGAHNALLEGKQIGTTTIQFFTANQRQWNSKPLTPESIKLWHSTLEQTQLTNIMSHDSYLINLGCPAADNLGKSRSAFREEIERCLALGVKYLNFHPGAALDAPIEQCLDLIVESLLGVQDLFSHGPRLRLLLETTAGQGSTVGCRFEQLAYILDKAGGTIPLGVCIDTCHIFVAGYDIRTAAAVDATLNEFDRVIGLQHLYAFHFNDSTKGLGSRVDRHQPLGEGAIGLECFKTLMTDPRTRLLPKYLETPGGPPLWTREIALLRSMGA